MDYRKFLGRTETLVLPYLGGSRVDARDRRLRVEREVAPGYWRFRVAGRTASAVEPADAEGLDALPAVRGHHVGGWLVSGGAAIERVHLMPEEQPAVLAPCRARRWWSGDLLFDSVEFETEAEDEARRALEDERSIEGVKGVSAALRAAFGLALIVRAARALHVTLSPMEARAHVLAVVTGGRAAADAILRALEAERREESLRVTARRVAARARQAPARSPEERAESALAEAGARTRSVRRLGDRQIEVRFDFLGETFIAVAAADTLQIHDAGICLAGADQEVTLESLPSVIREAIETSRLVITRT